MTSQTLGQRICARRNALGLSQSALGEELGVSRQSVFKWESDAAIPEIDKLIALSRLFGVSLDWLLGVGESPEPEADAPEAPTQDFTERERQILDALTHQPPAEPRWKKWVLTGAAVCTAAALVLSGLSWLKWKQTSEALEAAQAQIEKYTAYIQTLVTDGTVVIKELDYDCTPNPDLTEARVRMHLTPYAHQEGQSASLTVLLGGEVHGLYSCHWTGVVWVTEFDLAAADGYQFLFKLTDETGTELNQGLQANLLSQMGRNLAWPKNHSVTWEKLEIHSGSFTFSELTVTVPLPGAFRYTENLWDSCELVLVDSASTVLARFDLMHRSQYSAQINFSGSDVDFTTQTVQLLFTEPSVGDTLHLFLNGQLSTGHSFSYPVEQWKMTSDGLTTSFREPKT